MALFFHRAVLLLILLTLVAPVLAASEQHMQFAPVVAGQPAQSQTTAVLLNCQCGAVQAALLPDGRVFLTVQNHDVGGIQFWIDPLTSNTLIDVPEPAHITASYESVAPALDFPAIKTGPGSTIVVGEQLVSYAGARFVPNGRYNLARYTQPIAELP